MAVLSAGKQSVSFAVLCAVFFVYRLTFGETSSWVCALVKCLPILYLIALSYQNSKHASQPYQTVALFFSVLGDYTLACAHSDIMLGALFFAIAHVGYLLVVGKTSPPFSLEIVKFGIPLGVFYIYLLSTIHANLLAAGLVKLVVLNVYYAFLTYMTAKALSAWWTHRTTHTFYRMLGFVLFFASDSCIALKLFAPHLNITFAHVMATYYAAQYLIYYASTTV